MSSATLAAPVAATADLSTALVAPFERLRMTDVETVGGKNASLGEMISQLASTGVRVPGGFATTAHAFRVFLQHGGLAQRIQDKLATLNVEDVNALAAAGTQIRQWIVDTPFPADLEAAIREQFSRQETSRPASLCVLRPRPKTCPTRHSLASRRPFSTSPASMTCCTA